MRDGHNNYTASPGIVEAREAVSADFAARGVDVPPDRVLVTSGTSEGIELALTAIVDEGEAVLVPSPTYPLYTAVLAKIGAEPQYYRTDPDNEWLPDLDHLRALVTDKTRALVIIDPNNPTGALYPDSMRRALIALAEEHGLVILADEVYGDLAYEGPSRRWPRRSRRADHFRIRACRSRTWHRLASGMDGRRRDAAARRGARCHQEAGGRTVLQSGTDAIRRGGRADRRPIASARFCAAEFKSGRPSQPSGETHRRHAVRRAARRVLRHATGDTATGPDRRGLRARGLRATGILCVYGSGFGTTPEDGFFRIVFLASPTESPRSTTTSRPSRVTTSADGPASTTPGG